MRLNRSDSAHLNSQLRHDGRDDGPPNVISGRRSDDRFRVDIDGQCVWLSCDAFSAFVALVAAGVKSASGNAVLERLTVCRLRKALGENGKRLIKTGAGQEYRLDIPKSQFTRRVFITPCFAELVGRRVISPEQSKLLRKHLRRRNLPEDMKPPRNRKATKRKPSGNRKATKRKPK